MKYCYRCGEELDDKMAYCPRCGTSQNVSTSYSNNTTNNNEALKGGLVGFLLTFFIGIIGFILCLCLGDERCKSAAKKTFVICLVFWIVVVILYVLFFLRMFSFI